MYEQSKVPEPGLPPGLNTGGVVWLRSEYQERHSELVTLADGARLVGVTKQAISNWQKRHSNFPRLVLLTGSLNRRTKWVVAAELIDFARVQRNKKRDRPANRRPNRPGAQIAAENVARYEESLRTLTKREKNQAQALKRTRDAKREAEKKLAEALARLDAEIAAVARIGDQKDHRTTLTDKGHRP
ncbi:hypothetical protein [Streptomyces sp. NPDC087294]|uniref:hypothetical protein n=1 Tax=Streptomyces sp. NPDC087294 TaxID=3365777 RepID=UPI00380C3ED7